MRFSGGVTSAYHVPVCQALRRVLRMAGRLRAAFERRTLALRGGARHNAAITPTFASD